MGLPWVYEMTRGESIEADNIGRNLVALGERELEKREGEKRVARADMIPLCNTMFGVNIEREARMTEREKAEQR